MTQNLQKISLREVLIILLPGLYFISFLAPIKHIFGLNELNNDFANSTILILLPFLTGIILYWIDLPKKIPFFTNNLPTHILIKELNNIDKIEIINSYFKYYDSLSEEEKAKTNTYTSIYHFCTNIMIVSVLLLIIYYFSEKNNDYQIIILLIFILSLINSLGVFFGKRKIKYMFNRQIKGFKNSNEYKRLNP